jgi:hypothetical protein
VNTLLADPPAAPSSEQPPASGPPSLSPEDVQDFPRGDICAHCGAPLQEGQQWCLQCGACAPGSLGERPSWRPLGALALAAAILAAGAAVAVAAALNGHSSAPRAATVALAPAVTTPPPTASVPTTGLPAAPAAPGKSGAAKAGAGPSSKGSANSLLFPPSSTGKPPKVPAPTATPKSTGGSTGESSTGSSGESTTTTPASTKTTETATSTTEAKSKGEPSKSEPILLDTNSASTYNPYGYPEAGFGDPALAIDGESSTAWTAQVQTHSFPNLAEGLLIDLRSSTKLGSVELRTPTHGMTVQVYGANGAKAPATITTPGWKLLSSSHELKKTVTHLKLHAKGRSFRWLVVWIVKAPAASQGTPQAPGHVALSEVALYPPASS